MNTIRIECNPPDDKDCDDKDDDSACSDTEESCSEEQINITNENILNLSLSAIPILDELSVVEKIFPNQVQFILHIACF